MANEITGIDSFMSKLPSTSRKTSRQVMAPSPAVPVKEMMGLNLEAIAFTKARFENDVSAGKIKSAVINEMQAYLEANTGKIDLMSLIMLYKTLSDDEAKKQQNAIQLLKHQVVMSSENIEETRIGEIKDVTPTLGESDDNVGKKEVIQDTKKILEFLNSIEESEFLKDPEIVDEFLEFLKTRKKNKNSSESSSE
jgi:hypothetical protein